ncbi:hypothetical protein EXIGLDRAFT_741961 [Exidia glandulosa HHB12029]|uniref:Nuclear protein DGCR14 n=1 Tax=Exidia glandulosa HHB12029 TaxID=1314781 RepID=A0A165DDM4_EXIGL|nr:hypothetical protein EXIGLDRAFT_741961 [Exidia glandulosa HHB12029]
MSESTPRPGLSLNRQHVLDEDEYTEALSHIIARDFFPSLVHLESTNEYLDAVQSNDPARINQSVRRLAELHASTPLLTPGRTPYATPRHLDGQPAQKKPRLNKDLSLDDFQARYTSEDNSSFTQILDEENKQRQEIYKWAWNAERRANEVKALAIEGAERLLIEGPKPLAITQGEGEATSVETELKALVPAKRPAEDEQPVDVMAKKKDTRSATVDGWSFKNRNGLMFPPDADTSPFAPNPLESDPKEIKHNNTRLPEQSESAEDVDEPPSPTQSRIAAAIAGTPYRPSTDGPSVRGFGYVEPVPTITANELDTKQVKQLMTWGTLDATPRVLSGGAVEEPGTPFHLKAPSSREALGHRLGDKAVKSLRAKAAIWNGTPVMARTSGSSGRASMPPPRTPREGAGLLTPAAKRLLERTAGIRRAEAMNKSAGWEGKKERDIARVRWTPSPSPRRRDA